MGKIKLRLSGLWDHVVLQVDTYILEEHAVLKREYPPTWLQCHTEESLPWKPQHIYSTKLHIWNSSTREETESFSGDEVISKYL
jgi:hypothetical protein